MTNQNAAPEATSPTRSALCSWITPLATSIARDRREWPSRARSAT